VSKESRRAARLARESRQAGGAGTRPTGSTPVAADPAALPTTRTTRPVTGPRAGRRERVRPGPQGSVLERYRSLLITVAAIAVVAVGVGYVFVSSTQPAFACSTEFSPSPTPPITPGASDRLGFLQEDMGNSHVVATPQRYLYCPPASGNHFNGTGLGPIVPRVYKPEDKVGPSNWIHNLEHGAMVILYRGDSPGATAAGQQAFRDYFDAFPTSAICKVPPRQVSPVIARFDSMPHAFAAVVWNRVFYLDTWDPALVNQFYLTEAERLDKDGALVAPPEDTTGCKARIAPSGAPSAAPSASVAPSVAPSASAAPSASPQPSAAAS
jgi:hypothetical protein